MKKALTLGAVILATVLVVTAFRTPGDEKAIESIAIGTALPKADLKMTDVSGKEIALNDAKGKNGLLVVFSCNTCPYVVLYESRIKEAYFQAKGANIGVILVNSNEAQREGVDSYEEMKKHAANNKYEYNYVVDKGAVLADAFGATRTPEVFLFDKDGKLVYKGAIDDSPKDMAAAKDKYLRDALKAVADGKSVSNSSTKSVGCTIKRK